MASIITATTTSGLTQSADNSGVLQLASGTGNLVTIPSVTGTAMVSGNMPAFSAWANSNTALSNTTWTKITIDTEDFDTANCFASSRFTPNVAGYYQVNGSVLIAGSGSATTVGIVGIYKTGTRTVEGTTTLNTALNAAISVCSSIIYLNGTTDYIELYAYQNSGGALNALAGSTVTRFSASLVRAA